MKTIVIKTKKVVSHKRDGMPVIETIEQKIGPEFTFNKWLKYLPNQNFQSAVVVRVLESTEVKNKMVNKEIDEVEKYQALIDKALKSETKLGEEVDYKALSEKQSSQLQDALNRIAALEDHKKGKDLSNIDIPNKDAINQIMDIGLKNEAKKINDKIVRLALESKANELEMKFDKRLGDAKLLEKIQAIEPEFNIE